MRSFIGWPVAIICVGFLSHSAFAGPQTSIAELLKQGYEIKGTAFIPLQDAQGAIASATQGQLVVTLQRGQSIAVCEYGWSNWAAIATAGVASFTAADRCDVPGQP
jgi:hypothetical protein